MQLKDLARAPQLKEITIDDEDVVAEFGEAITFHTWDRQPMSVFLKLAQVNQEDFGSVLSAVRELVLDANGEPVLTETVTLPTSIMMRVITRVVEDLGKLSTAR